MNPVRSSSFSINTATTKGRAPITVKNNNLAKLLLQASIDEVEEKLAKVLQPRLAYTIHTLKKLVGSLFPMNNCPPIEVNIKANIFTVTIEGITSANANGGVEHPIYIKMAAGPEVPNEVMNKEDYQL